MISRRWIRRCVFAILLTLATLTPASAPLFAQSAETGGASGLPLPRFVSLKSDSVNVRRGPSRDQAVIWRYVRAGMPVEVTQEFENWRRVRDFEGGEGWVFHSLLAGTRTVLIAPWQSQKTPYELYASADETARVTARVEPGVQAQVSGCDGSWCLLKGVGFSGYINQKWLWGVYPGEKF